MGPDWNPQSSSREEFGFLGDTLRQTKIAMENGPFEDVSSKNGDIPSSHVSLPESNSEIQIHWKTCQEKVRPGREKELGYQFDIGSPKITSRQLRMFLVISLSSLHRSDKFTREAASFLQFFAHQYGMTENDWPTGMIICSRFHQS